MPTSTTETASMECWEFVKNLLNDLQAEEEREQLATLFGQWRLSLKAFRRAEAQRITLQDCPTEADMLFHRACVTELISVGTLIEIGANEHSQDELAKHGLRLETIHAYLQDLRNTLDEWHGQVPESRLETIRNRIFYAPPELNFQDSRA
jgi:uncharacterized DUF497 family protein